jgi:hemoglobin
MTSADRSLYQRLGGYDVIAAVFTDYVNRMRADPKMARFSGGRGADKKARDLQLNIDYMCKAAGGPMYYLGRDLRTAHAGLNITDEEWAVNMRYMAEALDAQNVSGSEKAEFLAVIEGMRGDIVER